MKGYIVEFWNFRELFVAFTLKEIKIRYKQTLLGIGWAILQPAALTIIFTVVFSIFLKIDTGEIPYPVFAYSGLLPWTFFTSAVTFGSLSIVNNSSLVTKVYFPREIMPLSSIGAAFFDLIMAALIFAFMILFYRVEISINIFLVFLIVPSILFLTIGISLFLSTLNVLFRDIRFIIPLLLQIWLYLTPIIYSQEQIPVKYRFLLLLNPLAPLIQSFRDVTVLSKQPSWPELIRSILISIIILFSSYWFFKKKEKIFADVI